jgi:hypothetical protein
MLLRNAHVSRCTNEFFHTGTPNVHNRVHKDNVTSPPVSYVRFGLDFLENKDKSAVTVGQILERHFREYVKMQEDSGLRESHAFTVRINRPRSRSTQCEGTNKHVELACKDVVMSLGAVSTPRKHFIQTRGSRAALLGANDGGKW